MSATTELSFNTTAGQRITVKTSVAKAGMVLLCVQDVAEGAADVFAIDFETAQRLSDGLAACSSAAKTLALATADAKELAAQTLPPAEPKPRRKK